MRAEDVPLDENLLSQLKTAAYKHAISPLFLRNYCARARHPVARPFRALENEARELVGALSDDEICALAASIHEAFLRMGAPTMPLTNRAEVVERLAPIIVEWRVALLRTDVRDLLKLRASEGEVVGTYPELANQFDEDDLLFLDDRFQLTDGAVLYKDHAFHYHQLLRRNFTARPNFDLLGRFANYATSTRGNQYRIALDHSRIMSREWYEQLAELSAWYGPPWNANRLDDPAAVGLTVVGRNQNSLFSLSNGLAFTDFLWTYRDGIKTFQIEEVSESDFSTGGFNLNRYVHSERDITTNVFRHLDGAVKVYLKEHYGDRLTAHLPDVAPCQVKPKLFRIDGVIQLPHWLNLIGFFFRDNEMVFEYFSPEQFEARFPLRVRDFEAWKAAGKPDDV
jgi:hypothetical protein